MDPTAKPAVQPRNEDLGSRQASHAAKSPGQASGTGVHGALARSEQSRPGTTGPSGKRASAPASPIQPSTKMSGSVPRDSMRVAAPCTRPAAGRSDSMRSDAQAVAMQVSDEQAAARLSMSHSGSLTTRFRDLPSDQPASSTATAAGAPPSLHLQQAATAAASEPPSTPPQPQPKPETPTMGLPKWGTRASALGHPGKPVPNARSLVSGIHALPHTPIITLTQQLWSRSVWDLLKGGAPQQRVWTLGNSLQSGGELGKHTCQRPLPLIEGAAMTCVAAGLFHGAAVAAGSSEVYTWGAASSELLKAMQEVPRHQRPPETPWLPYDAQLVSLLPISEAELLPRVRSISGLLDKLPASLRQAIRETDPEGEKMQLDTCKYGVSELRLWRVQLPVPVLLVACGAAHTLVALSVGGIMAWGTNSKGQVGLPAEGNEVVDQPVAVTGLDGIKVVSLAGGAAHSVAVTADGTVRTWGDNSYGQLGLGHASPGSHSHVPTEVELLSVATITKVACGSAHTLALTDRGSVYAWGSDSCGQLGPSKERKPRGNAAAAAAAPQPQPGSCSDGQESTLQDAGGFGSLFASCSGVPCRVMGLPPCAQVAASGISGAVSEQGQVFLWGYDAALNPAASVLLQGTPSSISEPAIAAAAATTAGSGHASHAPCIHEVAWLWPKKARSLALGPSHALVATEDESVYAWGHLHKALGYPLVSKARKVWLSDEQLLAALGTARGRAPGAVGKAAGKAAGAAAIVNAREDGSDEIAGDPAAAAAAAAVAAREEDVLDGVEAGGQPSGEAAADFALHGAQASESQLVEASPTACEGAEEGAAARTSACGHAATAVPAGAVADAAGEVPPGAVQCPVQAALEDTREALPEHSSVPSSLAALVGRLGASPEQIGEQDGCSVVQLFWQQLPGALEEDVVPLLLELQRQKALKEGSQGAGVQKSQPDSHVVDGAEVPHLAIQLPSGTAGEGTGKGQPGITSTTEDIQGASPASPSYLTPGNTDNVNDVGQSFDEQGEQQPLLPQQEPIFLLAAGHSHSIVLCATTHYQAPPYLLHQLGTLLLCQVAWQYNEQRAYAERTVSPLRVPSPERTQSFRRGESPVNGQQAASSAFSCSSQIPSSLLQLPEASGRGSMHEPWRDAVVGPELCVLLCRQVGLVDNLVEYMDVLAIFARHIAYKRGREPPSILKREQHPGSSQQRPLGSPSGRFPRSPPPTREGRPTSPSRLVLVDAASLQRWVENEVAAAPGLGLTGEELLDLMLDLMSDRHPDLVEDYIERLRILGSIHLPLLQLRAPEGLPWVLSKVLTPRVLQQLDSGTISEQLHRAYVYMTSLGIGSPEDLHLGLKDMKMGLKTHPPSGYGHQHNPRSPTADDKPASPGGFLAKAHALQREASAALSAASEAPRPQSRQQAKTPRGGTPMSRSARRRAAAGAETAASGPPPGSDALEVAAAANVPAFTVPMLRVSQFLRQAGLVPKVVSQLITDILEEFTPYLRRIPFHELTPWWWPRDLKLRPHTTISNGLGAFRTCPETVNLLQQPVLLGILCEYDIMGTALPRTRKLHEAALSSDAFSNVEQRKRDRLLAYILAHLLGNYLAPLIYPDQQKPSYLLALPVSYPQFVEAVGACLVLRTATQNELGLLKEIKTSWPASAFTSSISFAMENLALWRDRVLCPWKFNRIFYTDAELDSMIDKVFSLFCTINPLENKVTMNVYNFQRMMEACNMYDDVVDPQTANLIFLVCSRLNPKKIYDFAAFAKDMEKRDHAYRLTMLQQNRRNQATQDSALEELMADVPDYLRLPGYSAPSTPAGNAGGRDLPGLVMPGMGKSHNTHMYVWEIEKKKADLEKERQRKQIERRRKAMGARSKNSDESGDSDTETPLPEGWPRPNPGDVQLLATMEMPTLTVPRHRPGELTYLQMRQLQLDLAELPDDEEWSGLTRKQMGRLNSAPLVLKVARQELQQGLQPVADMAEANGRTLWDDPLEEEEGGFMAASWGWAQGTGDLSDGVGSGGRTPSPGHGARSPNSRQGSPSRPEFRSGPGGPPLLAQELASAPGAGIITTPFPGPSQITQSAKAALTLLASLDDPQLARSFRAPAFSPGDGSSSPERVRKTSDHDGASMHATPASGEVPLPKMLGESGGLRSVRETEEAAGEVGVLGRTRTPTRVSVVLPHEQSGGLGRLDSESRPASPSRLSKETGVDPATLAAQQQQQQRPPGSGDGADPQQRSRWGGGDSAGAAGAAGAVGQQRQRRGSSAGAGASHGAGTAGGAAGSQGLLQEQQQRPGSRAGAGHGSAPGTPAAGAGDTSPRRERDRLRSKSPAELLEEVDEMSRANTPKKAIAVPDTVNRLTTTRTTLATGMRGMGSTANPSDLYLVHLDRMQFGEVVRRLAVTKFSKISSPIAAWRILVDRHILPASENRPSRFDAYHASLLGPSVISTVLIWEPQLKRLFSAYARPEMSSVTAGARAASLIIHRHSERIADLKTLRKASSKHGGMVQQSSNEPKGTTHEYNEKEVSLVSYLKLLQDRRILPQMLPPSDMEEVFRRVYFGTGGCTVSIQPLSYPQFTDCCCMTALALYDQQKYRTQYHSLEDRLEAFFSILCGLPLPKPTPLAATAHELVSGKVPEDPYKTWWDLATDFKAEDDTKAVSYLSSRDYCSVLIQELVLPPESCPPDIIALIEEATCLHNNGRYDEALEAYATAQQQWQDSTTAKDLPSSDPVSVSYVELGLLTHQRLYFHLAMGSVLLSAGRYQDALDCYDIADEEADRLPQAHPNRAMLHSCRAFALNAVGRLSVAFEHLVKAMIIRSQALGLRHVDAQLTCHNLGCVLDRLGCEHRALELLEEAHKVFRQSLGSHHPRTQAACRNIHHVQHKCTHLEMHYAIRPDKPKQPKVELAAGASIMQKRKAAAAAIARASRLAGTPGSPRRRAGGGVPGDKDGAAASGPPPLTLQQRLAAFRLRRHGKAGVPHGPADLMYLGGGIHAPSDDTLAVYENVKGDIARHASGAAAMKDLPEDVMLVQRHQASLHQQLPRVAVKGGVPDQTLAFRRAWKRQEYGRIVLSNLPPLSSLGEEMMPAPVPVFERLVATAVPTVTRRRFDGSRRSPKRMYTDKLAQLLAPKKVAPKVDNKFGHRCSTAPADLQ